MYKLRGAPRAFETREAALLFLQHSPGYVRRQRKYLERFWPGLLAEVAPGSRATPDSTMRQRPRAKPRLTPGLNPGDAARLYERSRGEKPGLDAVAGLLGKPFAKAVTYTNPVTGPLARSAWLAEQAAGLFGDEDEQGRPTGWAGTVQQAGVSGALEKGVERGLGIAAVSAKNLHKVPGDIKQIASGLGVLAVQLGYATTGDLHDAVRQGEFDFSRSRTLGSQIVTATIADYRARYGKDWRKHASEDPLFFILDGLAGGGAATKGATIGAKIRRGANPALAVRQAFRPQTGTLREGNLVAHPVLSRNAAVAAGQRLVHAGVQRAEHRDVDAVSGPVARQAQRVMNAAARYRARRVGQEAAAGQRTADAVGRSHATALRRMGTRLTLPQQVALRVVHEGAPLDDVIASIRGWATEAKTPKQRKALAEMGNLRETARAYLTEVDGVPTLRTDFRRPVPGLHRGRVGVNAETLQEVSRMIDEVAGDEPGGRERILLDMQVLTPEQIAYRKNAPGRVHLGARWIDESKLARQIEGQMGVDFARSDLTPIGPDVPIERPRTASEAKAKLSALDKEVDRILRPIVDEQFPPAARQSEQALRNVRPKGKRAQAAVSTKLEVEGMGGTSRSVLRDATAAVEARILEMAERPDAGPAVVRMAQLIEERDGLRASFGENFLAELEGAAGEAPFGMVTETRPAPPTSLVTSETPGRPGLVGAEDFTGGLSRIPDVPKWKLEPAAAQRAKLETGAVPQAPGSVRHGYTGALRRTGNIREDTARLVAESHREAQRFGEATATHDLAALAGNPIRFEGSAPIKVRALNPAESIQLKTVLSEAQRAAESGTRLSRAERQRYADAVARWRSELFPDETEFAHVPVGESVPGVVWVPKSMLRQMNAPIRRLVIPGRGLRAFDDLLSAMRFGILLSKGTGYVIPQVAGNLFMNLVQQGGKAFVNTVARAPLMTRRYGARVSSAVDEVMGQGATRSLLEGFDRRGAGKVTAAVSWVGEKLNIASDMAFRRSAFEYEARRKGFAGREGMTRLLFDKANGEQLTEVANRARAAIGDFERMGLVERDVIRRGIFVYPWLKVATRYGIKFLVEHPVASNVAASQAEGALHPAPGYASELVPVGGTEEQPYAISTAGANPLSTFGQIAETVTGTVTGDYPTFGSLGGYLNPAIEAGAQAAFGRNLSTGQPARAGLPGFGTALIEQTAPETLRRRLSEADEDLSDKTFPYSETEALGQYFGGSIAPRPVNRDVLEERAQQEDDADLTSPHRARRKVFRERQQVASEARRLVGVSKLPPALREAYNARAAVEAARAASRKAHPDGGDPYARDVFIREARLAATRRAISRSLLREIEANVPNAPAHVVERNLRRFRDQVWGDGLDTIREARVDLEERGATFQLTR
jgi:hypothetical protein